MKKIDYGILYQFPQVAETSLFSPDPNATPSIGDIIFDSREENFYLLEDNYDVEKIGYVAPELYHVFIEVATYI